MAVAFDTLTTDDDALNRVQANVSKAFKAVPAQETEADGIRRVDTSSGTKAYTVVESDRHIVGLTNGNALTVSLPDPRTKRTLGVIASGANPVTVQRADGKACSFGQTKVLTNAASLFVADGKDWYLG